MKANMHWFDARYPDRPAVFVFMSRHKQTSSLEFQQGCLSRHSVSDCNSMCLVFRADLCDFLDTLRADTSFASLLRVDTSFLHQSVFTD
jgi:hypothetical protein